MRSCPQCRSLFTGEGEFCTIDGTRLVEDVDDPLIGERIDRYRFVERLGTGAMGVVYRVRHTELDRDFAIKVLYGEFAASESLSARFRREAKAMSRMSHPNVVSVVDFGSTAHGLEFLVMEYIEGRTLEDLIEESGRIEPRHAAWIARQIAAGLHEAHRLGFVHRDVKPANVMLSGVRGRERAQVLDFGIVGVKDDSISAKLTGTGRIVGTPRYMSPEQARATDVGPPADLYSLGVVLYEMLSGEVPFPGDVLADVLVMHSTADPAPLPPSGGLETVVDRLLVKRFEDRVQSGADVVALLDACFDDLAPSFPSVVEDEIPTERPARVEEVLEIPPLADEELRPFPRSDSGLGLRTSDRPVSSPSIYDSAPAAFADPTFRAGVETSGFDAPGSDKLSQVETPTPQAPTHEGSQPLVSTPAPPKQSLTLPLILLAVVALAIATALGFPRFAEPPTPKRAPVAAATPAPPPLPHLIPLGIDHRPDRRGLDPKRPRRRRRRVRPRTETKPTPPSISVAELEFALGHVLAQRGLSLTDLEGLRPTRRLARAWRTAKDGQTDEQAAATLAPLIEATRSVTITRAMLKRKARRARRAFDRARGGLDEESSESLATRMKTAELRVRTGKPKTFDALAREIADIEKSLATAPARTVR